MAQSSNIRLKPPSQVRVLLVDGQVERAQLFISVLADRGYAVVETAHSADDAVDVLLKDPDVQSDAGVDLIVFYSTNVTGDALGAIKKLTSVCVQPLLVITESADPDVIGKAIAAGAAGCQPMGVNADRVQSGVVGAIEINKRLQELRSERDRAVKALADRRLIDRAKAIVMNSRSFDEQEAFTYLQQLSMKRNTPLAEIAATIIEAQELLG